MWIVEFNLNLNARNCFCSLLVVMVVYTSNNYQILRDEEGKKLGLKANEKNSGSKDNDVKMTDAEVIFCLSSTCKLLNPFVSAAFLTSVCVLHIGIIQWKR